MKLIIMVYIVQVALLCNPVSWGQSEIVQYSKSFLLYHLHHTVWVKLSISVWKCHCPTW